MTSTEVWGARLVWSWVRLYTKAMPVQVAGPRREELLSDIYDQVADSTVDGVSGTRLSWAMCGRMLRGLTADVAWRARVEADLAGRDVVLARPGAVLVALGVGSLPFSIAAELIRAHGWLHQLHAPSFALAWSIWMLTVAYGLVVAVDGAIRRQLAMGSLRAQRGRLLRLALPLLCFLYAVSGVWRFEQGPLAVVSTGAWAAFGLVLVASFLSGLIAVTRRVAKGLTIGR